MSHKPKHRGPKSPHHVDVMEERLRTEHKELFHHWSDKVGLDVNPTISENTYKHHIARLFHVYTHHKTTIDHKHPVQDARRTSPITRLYGVHGIASTKKSKSADLKRKEQRWENRMILTSNLEDMNRKSKARAEIEDSMLRSSFDKRPSQAGNILSARPRTAPSSGKKSRPDGTHLASHTSSRDRKKAHARSHRVDFEGVSDNDLIANGLYYLDDEQLEVYDRFTSLLACHDTFDMVKILEDALHDAKRKTGLDDYGGTQLSTDGDGV